MPPYYEKPLEIEPPKTIGLTKETLSKLEEIPFDRQQSTQERLKLWQEKSNSLEQGTNHQIGILNYKTPDKSTKQLYVVKKTHSNIKAYIDLKSAGSTKQSNNENVVNPEI